MSLPYPSLRQGLVGAWCPSLGTSGYLLPNRARQSNNATHNGAITAAPGGTTLDLSGTQFADLGSSATLYPSLTSLTWSGWVRMRSFPNAYNTLTETQTDTTIQNNYQFTPLIKSTGQLALYAFGGYTTQSSYDGTGVFTLAANTWYHLAFVFLGGVSLAGYVNGILDANVSSPIATLVASTGPVRVGRSVFGTRTLNGQLDDIRIYSRVLTPAEIRLLASRRGIGLSPFAPLHDDDSESVQYPITDPPNRVLANVDGVWVPSQVRANTSGTWGNGETKVNQGGVWPARQYHQESLFWKSRVETVGGTVSDTTLDAVSAFCAAVDAAGIRDRFARLNLFCGTGLSACLTPLYLSLSYQGGELGNATDRNFNFVAGDYVETGANGGLKGNGTTTYLNTGFPANTFAAANSHLGVGLVTANTLTGNREAIGAYNGGQNSFCITMYSTVYRSAIFTRFATATDNFGVVASPSTPAGNLIAAWPTFYRDGSAVGVNATTSQNYPSAHPFFVFANSSSGTTAIDHTDARLNWYSIGLTMTAAQVAAYNSALATFRTAMGRS